MKFPRKWLRNGLLIIILGMTLIIAWQVAGYYQQWHRNQERQRLIKAQKKEEKTAERRQTLGLVTGQSQWAQEADRKLQAGGYSGSALIVDQGKPVLHKGYGYADQEKQIKNQPDSLYPLASITKNLTAVMVMRALKQKGLSVDTELAHFYPTLAGSQDVTVKDLLTMMSGYQEVPFPKKLLTEKRFYRYIVQHTHYQGQPDKWHYESVNYQLLAGILYQLTGKDFQTNSQATFADYRLMDANRYFNDHQHAVGYRNGRKMDVDSKFFRQEIGTGNMMGSDWALYQVIRDELRGQLLTTNQFEKMTTPYPNESYAGGVYTKTIPGAYYMHGIMLGFEPTVIIDRTGKHAVVLLSNHYETRGGHNSDLAKQIYQTMLKHTHQTN